MATLPLTWLILVVCLVVYTTAQEGISSAASIGPFFKQVDGPKVMLWDYENKQTKEGYRYVYQTSDNSYRLQEGVISNPGTDKEELVVMGRFTYRIGDIDTVVEYVADKNGYRPKVQVRWLPILSIPPKLLGSLAG